mgnify:CR=1 FL=1
MVRNMTIADYEQVYALWMQIKGFAMRSVDDSKDGVARFLERNPKTSVVAVEDDKVVGAILCGHDGRRGCMYHVCVHPDYRRKGIGKEMVVYAMKRLQEEGISKVSLIAFTSNDVGNAFWNTIGWTKREDLNYYDFTLNEDNIIRFNVKYDESNVNITEYGIDPGDEPPLPSGFIITRTYDVLPSIPVKVTRNYNTLTLDLGSTYYVEVAQSNSLSFEGKSYYWKVDSTNTLTDDQLSLLDTYFENRLMLTNGDKTAYYAASKTLFEGDLPDGITLTLLQSENDLRHQSKSYVWEVTANKDINSIISTADTIFGESDKILTTLNSVYYLSKNGNYNVDALINAGYTVRLLEVLNTHSPASGIVVFTTKN